MSSIAVDGGGMQTVKKPPRKKIKKTNRKRSYGHLIYQLYLIRAA